MRIRVLIFDDEEMIRKTFKMLLRDRNYEIYDFNSPSICPLYNQNKCECPLNEMCTDIIITDIRMPEVDGIKFIKEQKEKGCKVKNIVIVSAYIDETTKMEVQELGCVCLKKPFKPSELNEILDKFEKNIDPNRKLSEWDNVENKE